MARIKFVISSLCLTVAICVFLYDYYIGLAVPAFVALAAGLFITSAIWVFPDVRRK